MSIDPYASCPCGSGKAFKWCCQSYYAQVEKALMQQQRGQAAAAEQTLDQLVKQYHDKAPVWGYKAQLLLMNGQPEQADEVLQKAFAIHPDFPLGHWLRGIIRQNEGEIKGALIEFRKAAELYDPKAHDMLGQIFEMIADIELRMNRPMAARAAMEQAKHYQPANEEIRRAFEGIFGADSRLPQVAKESYTFRSPSAHRADAWKKILEGTQGKLSAAAKSYEQLTTEDPNDSAAWFNLGLVRAWLGEHPKAVEALDRYIQIEDDIDKFTQAAAMMELLRCGAGMEQDTDYHEFRVFFQIPDPQSFMRMLSEWEGNHRLVAGRVDQRNQSLSAIILEDVPNLGMGIGNPVAPAAAYMFVIGNMMQLWHPNKESLDKVASEVKLKLGIIEAGTQVGPISLGDVILEAISFPHQQDTPERVHEKMQEHATNFFEHKWLNRSLRSLSGLSPVDAAGMPTYRKRLLGVIRFLEEAFQGATPKPSEESPIARSPIYDFNQLRRKLGLLDLNTIQSKNDIDAMSTAELASLLKENLSEEDLGRAFQACKRLDATELATEFAKTAIARPIQTDSLDRYPFFTFLIKVAQDQNDSEGMLKLLEEAVNADQQTNAGKRANDYAMRRGQILAKSGQIDQAFVAYEAVLNHSDELQHFMVATESMLSHRQGTKAAQFAEKGLQKARNQNNRDAEQAFLELQRAAQKQM